MSTNLTDFAAPAALASTVLTFVLREWENLADLGVRIYDRFTRDRIDAPLEILRFNTVLELQDARGRKAHLHRTIKTRFLQDYTIALQDFVWGDGDPIAAYKITPGRVVDKFRESDRWNLLVSLQRTMNRGEIEDFVMERTAVNGFTKREEWLQVETWLPTKYLKMRVLFPIKRPCKRAWIAERSRHRTVQLTSDAIQTLPDGRTELTWEKKQPRRSEVFTLKWQW